MESQESDEDKLSFLRIFPNEVWEKIMGNVTEAKDYHKISSASPHFRTVLLLRASQILFPEVIKLLTKHQFQSSKCLGWIETRRVCQAWKNGLDKVLERQNYFLKHNNVGDLFGIKLDRSVLAKHFIFDLAEEFARFEMHFDSTHLNSGANPFMQRKVQLPIFNDEDGPEEQYYDACLQFLEKYGHHLWYCIIVYILDKQTTQINFYNQRLSAILELMPNLRALEIANLGLGKIPDEVAPTSFPTLPKLKYIHFTYLPLVVIHELLQRNPQIQCMNSLDPGVEINVILDLLPNLRSVAFKLEDEQELEIAQLATPSRVERIWLDLMCNLNAQRVFLELQRRFSQSPVELHLRLSRFETLKKTTRLVLPRLKILFLEMEEPQRLEFLLLLKPTLEELRVLITRMDKRHKKCQFGFQLYKFWKEPQKSNIWNVFPKLKILETRVMNTGMYCCTRKECKPD